MNLKMNITAFADAWLNASPVETPTDPLAADPDPACIALPDPDCMAPPLDWPYIIGAGWGGAIGAGGIVGGIMGGAGADP